MIRPCKRELLRFVVGYWFPFVIRGRGGAGAGRTRPCAAFCDLGPFCPPAYSSPLAAASRFFLAGAGGRVVSISTSALILSGSSQ